MLAGESGLGKTTFINTLFSTTVKGFANDSARHSTPTRKTVEIGITKAELEEKGFKIRLNIIDTPGFGDNVNNKEAWQPLIDFIDDQHESYLRQEQQPNRRNISDSRVHACLYFIRPSGHSLKPLDIAAMKHLGSRVNLIPVIAKADTLSPSEVIDFKHRIRQVLDAQSIEIYKPAVDDMEPLNAHGSKITTPSEAKEIKALIDAMPFTVIGSEKDIETKDGGVIKGRQYLWGVAEVFNEDHCDFIKLRLLLIRTHMLDLIQTTENGHFEAYRAEQMETRQFGEARPRKSDNPIFRKEEESLRVMFGEQVKIEEKRFKQWEQNLIAERERLNKDLEVTHTAIRQLELEVQALSVKARR